MIVRPKYLGKIIAFTQILVSVFMMFSLYWSIMDQEVFMADEHAFIGEHVKPKFHWGFVANQQIYLMILLCFLGGMLWLFNKASGWVISFCFWLSCLLFSLIYTLPTMMAGRCNYWVFLAEISICFPFLIFLGLKPVLQKYSISKKHWLMLGVSTMFVSLDLYWHRLF